jgi:hypothetical protein
MARVLFDVRDHASVEDDLPIVLGIEPSIEVEIRTSRTKPVILATLFNAFRPSGSSTISVSFTGATGSGDNT